MARPTSALSLSLAAFARLEASSGRGLFGAATDTPSMRLSDSLPVTTTLPARTPEAAGDSSSALESSPPVNPSAAARVRPPLESAFSAAETGVSSSWPQMA